MGGKIDVQQGTLAVMLLSPVARPSRTGARKLLPAFARLRWDSALRRQHQPVIRLNFSAPLRVTTAIWRKQL